VSYIDGAASKQAGKPRGSQVDNWVFDSRESETHANK